jgi:hypothetical protein
MRMRSMREELAANVRRCMKSFMLPEKQSNIILLCQVCDHHLNQRQPPADHRPGPPRLHGADNLAELRTVSAHQFRLKRIPVRLLPSLPFCPSPVLTLGRVFFSLFLNQGLRRRQIYIRPVEFWQGLMSPCGNLTARHGNPRKKINNRSNFHRVKLSCP